MDPAEQFCMRDVASAGAVDDQARSKKRKRKTSNCNSLHETSSNLSADMEANIREIRQRIDRFTLQVSEVLDTVKSFFAQASNAFEENLMQLHDEQIAKWEEEIGHLMTIDSKNEDLRCRLNNVRELFASMS